MPIDFHAEQNRQAYTSRQADSSWRGMIGSMVEVRGRRVVDIGCGGGIYTLALAEMGAAHVTGLDFSEEMLKGAREHCRGQDTISFVSGNALATGLPGGQYDLALERALVHHLKQQDLPACFTEAARLLATGGVLIVQDRTPTDCLLPGSSKHIRGYFFARYPRLTAQEIARRHTSAVIIEALQLAGFQDIQERKLWETRAIYPDFAALAVDLLARKGRSLLYELSDTELEDLVAYIQRQPGSDAGKIVEQDRWTLWRAEKA